MLDRRTIIQGVSTLATLGIVPGCATIGSRRADIGFAAIDIHSHFFNASDLPVTDFLNRVVLRDHNDYSSQAEFKDKRVRRAFINLLTEILRFRTPTADEEIAKLQRQPRAKKVAVRSLSKEAVNFGLQRQAEIVRRQQFSAAKRLNQKSLNTQRSAAPAFTSDEALLAEIESSVGLAPVRSNNQKSDVLTLSTSKSARSSRVKRVVDEIYRFADKDDYRYTGIIPTALRWAGLLTEDRTEILDEYVRLYQEGARSTSRGLIATSPSIVDFAYWLDLDSEKKERRAIPSSLSSQVNVISKIAHLRTDIALIPFVPFDPLREVIGKISGRSPSLDLVKDAVLKKGFAGVKLYPPMGFRPINNDASDVDNDYADGIYQKALRRADITSSTSVGEALDESLMELYSWAQYNNVPIKAHANNSIESQRGGGQKASPAYWADVLSKFTRLKVNLAHFGGFEEKTFCDGRSCDSNEVDWEDLIGDIITNNRNLYFDTGYWMELITDKRRGLVQVRERTRQFFSKFPKAKKQVMFGTDWSMIGKDPGHERYLEIMDQTIKSLFKNDIAAQRNYFGGNAIEYLGLRKNTNPFISKQNTRSRFEDCYAGISSYEKLFNVIDGQI